MIPIPAVFPACDVPEGWKRELSGPHLWLIPPEPGGRIVLVPALGRPEYLDARELLERQLVQELSTFPRLKKSETTPIESAHGVPGFFTDVAGLDAAGEPTEWRSYAAFQDGPWLYLMFLQAQPPRYPALRRDFLAVAHSVRPRPRQEP